MKAIVLSLFVFTFGFTFAQNSKQVASLQKRPDGSFFLINGKVHAKFSKVINPHDVEEIRRLKDSTDMFLDPLGVLMYIPLS